MRGGCLSEFTENGISLAPSGKCVAGTESIMCWSSSERSTGSLGREYINRDRGATDDTVCECCWSISLKLLSNAACLAGVLIALKSRSEPLPEKPSTEPAAESFDPSKLTRRSADRKRSALHPRNELHIKNNVQAKTNTQRFYRAHGVSPSPGRQC